MHDLILRQDSAVEITIQTVLDGLDSPHSRRAYERHLREFIGWHRSTGQAALNKATVQRYAAELRDADYQRPQSINAFPLSANSQPRPQTTAH